MTLPDLPLQIVYGKLAWGIVLAAVIASLLPSALQQSRRTACRLGGLAMAVMLLPQQFSPAYWIALAFQWPSALLLACGLLKLLQPWRGANAGNIMPAPFAAAVATLGVLLYVEALGLLPLGVYYWGFGPQGAPLLALAAAVLCVSAILRGRLRLQHVAVLFAVALYSVWRLPTGNLWDALLDPMLFAWAVLALAVHGWRKFALPALAARQAPAATMLMKE